MPIKILFFIENLSGGGAEKVLCNLVNSMDQSRFEITVQTLWKADSEQLLRPGIHYRYCYADRDKANVLRSRYEAALGLTYRLYIKDDYDIECAYLEYGPTKVIAGSNNKKAVKLAWIHCDLQTKTKELERFAAKAEKWYRKYDKIICVSKTVKKSFDYIFRNRFSSVVLQNYINVQDILRRSEEIIEPAKPSDRPLLLAVGTLYPPKNYPRLLRTSKRLKEEGVKHELWIVGGGIQRKMLETYVFENDLSDCVRFFGFQKNPYPYFRLADLLVCSSNYEGFSTVVTEGLILGKPVVTTDCAGMDELLGDSEYGIITQNNDDAFYEGVKRFITDRQCRAHYTQQAILRGSILSNEISVEQTERFLEQCLKKKYN